MSHPVWMIWSIEHGAWWAPKRNGYCSSTHFAGRYTFEEAMGIVETANHALKMNGAAMPKEAMVLDVAEFKRLGFDARYQNPRFA